MIAVVNRAQQPVIDQDPKLGLEKTHDFGRWYYNNPAPHGVIGERIVGLLRTMHQKGPECLSVVPTLRDSGVGGHGGLSSDALSWRCISRDTCFSVPTRLCRSRRSSMNGKTMWAQWGCQDSNERTVDMSLWIGRSIRCEFGFGRKTLGSSLEEGRAL